MPHWQQNLALDWFSEPQAAQVGASGAPHLIQNPLRALVSAPQLGHFMASSRWLDLACPTYGTRASLHVVIDRQHLPRDDYPPTDVSKGIISPGTPACNSARAIA